MKAESSTIKHVSGAFPPPVPSTCACIALLHVCHSAHRADQVERHISKGEDLQNCSPVLCGARHPVHRTTLLVLCHRQTTRPLHVPKPLRPVASHPCHDQPRGARSKLLGHRPEQHIHRRSMPVHQRTVVQTNLTSCRSPPDFHVTVARRNKRPARYRQVSVPRFPYFQLAYVVQPSSHHRSEALRHVLHNHDPRVQVGRQPRKQVPQRVRSARRSADRNDLVLGSARR